MVINVERLKHNFDRITEITATELGCTRFSFSEEDKKVRKILTEEMSTLGMDVSVDFIGNIRAKYNPDNLNSKSILIGSHIDTVKFGGRYDGLTGVLSSIEVMRYIKENDIKLNHPIEIVIFAEEEGSNFGVTMLGSKYIAKKIDEDYLKNLYADNGISAYEVISNCNFLSGKTKQSYIDGKNECCMIELHVEQGEILDKEKIEIGIIQAIAGMKTLQITVEGTSNHAGTTPMVIRRDPVVASAKIIDKIADVPKDLNMKTAVTTVGKLFVSPNCSNVIASKVIFNVDIRDVIEENIQIIAEHIIKLAHDAGVNQNVEISVAELGKSSVVQMAEHLVNTIENCTKELGLSYIKMNSGAVHDNAMLNGIIDTAMIFIPSINGISHSPYEDTDFKNIISGVRVLLKSVISLAVNDQC
ncbi:MAG: M20 family metallo-hydrolase [Sedimentibacter sp.]